jgi:hypothetical protein
MFDRRAAACRLDEAASGGASRGVAVCDRQTGQQGSLGGTGSRRMANVVDALASAFATIAEIYTASLASTLFVASRLASRRWTTLLGAWPRRPLPFAVAPCGRSFLPRAGRPLLVPDRIAHGSAVFGSTWRFVGGSIMEALAQDRSGAGSLLRHAAALVSLLRFQQAASEGGWRLHINWAPV